MNFKFGFIILFIVNNLVNLTLGAKILGIFPYVGGSHFNFLAPFLIKLAERGHEVYVISCHPLKTPMPNYIDIDIRNLQPNHNENFNITIFEHLSPGTLTNIQMLYELRKDYRFIYESNIIQEFLKKNSKFDIVITELFNDDSFLSVVNKINPTVHIAMSSCSPLPWANDRFAEPDNPSYLREVLGSASHEMNFWDRINNMLTLLMAKTAYNYFFLPLSQELADKYFPVSDRIEDILKNTDLFFINNHFTIQGARPHVPAVIELAGLHIPPPRPLGKEVEQFLKNANDGAIYFNMGSMIRSGSMSIEKQNLFTNVFSKLKQKVLWKWEESKTLKNNDKLMVYRWFPQSDVLCHPNIALFISHGGLLSTIEAVNCGVPIIFFPIYGDQIHNSESVIASKAGIRLAYRGLTEESLLHAIKTILNNPEYAENAKKLSAAFRDRPLSPLDTAVYWTEYAFKHKNLNLKSQAVQLNWFQYHLLDVILFLTLSIVLILYFIKSFVKCLYGMIVKKIIKRKKD